jgi:hypothetical protein
MPSSLSSFFICQNPLAVFVEGLSSHIYHEAKPRFMSALFSIDADKYVEINFNGLNYPFLYIRGDGYRQMYVLIITDMIDRSNTTKLSHILQQAAAWYVTCMNKLDEKIYGRGLWSTLNDYHFTMPGIQVLEIKNAQASLLFYTGGVRTFKSDEELSKFLVKTLNYPDTEGLEVRINVCHQQVK